MKGKNKNSIKKTFHSYHPARHMRLSDKNFIWLLKEKEKEKGTWNHLFDLLRKKCGDEEDTDDEFSLKAEIKKLRDSNQRHIRIVGWYMAEKKVNIPSKKTFKAEIKRWVRDASFLSDYEDTAILSAFQTTVREYPDIWNLSTVKKVIVNL